MTEIKTEKRNETVAAKGKEQTTKSAKILDKLSAVAAELDADEIVRCKGGVCAFQNERERSKDTGGAKKK